MNVYDKAREVLKERGWTTATVGAQGGPTCLVGALGMAAGEFGPATGADRWYDLYAAAEPHVELVNDILREQYPDQFPSYCSKGLDAAYTWNDRHAESVERVDAVLDKAARAFDEQVQP